MNTNQNVGLTVEQLREAADLTESIAKNQAAYDALMNGDVAKLKTAVDTETEKLTKILGIAGTPKAKTGGNKGVRTQAQRDAISAGLKAKWALRKAAIAATTVPADTTPVAAV